MKIKSFQGQTGQTGQTKLTFKHGFQGNLCRAAFAILRCFYPVPIWIGHRLYSFFFVFDVWICSPLPFVFLLSYFDVCCLLAFGCTFLWIGPCFFCFICFYLLVRLHFHLSRPFFLSNPVIFGCICSYLFAQLHFPLSPSLLGPYLVGFIWKSLFFFTCLCGYTFLSHTLFWLYIFASSTPAVIGPYLVDFICKSLFCLVFEGTLFSQTSIFSSNF